MATIASLKVNILGDSTGLTNSLKNATDKMQAFGNRMSDIGQTLSTRLTLPIVGFGALAVKSASDAEETFSKFATVFRDVEGNADQAFKSLRDNYGLSSKASKQLLSDTGDLLTGFGFSQQAALELSTEVNKLAVDLASFTNFSGGAEGASQALTKALLGERESVKSLGIAILEEDVQKRVAINTTKGLTFESERQAKAFATLQIAQEQSKNAIGDYARTQDSFANQFRLLQARASDLATEFGQVMLPAMNRLVGVATDLIKQFSGLDEQTKIIFVSVAAFAAIIGPMILSIGILTKGVIALGTAFTTASGPVGMLIVALGLLGASYLMHASTVSASESATKSFVRNNVDYAKAITSNAEQMKAFADEAGRTADEIARVNDSFEEMVRQAAARAGALESELANLRQELFNLENSPGTGNILTGYGADSKQAEELRGKIKALEQSLSPLYGFLVQAKGGLDAFAKSAGTTTTSALTAELDRTKFTLGSVNTELRLLNDQLHPMDDFAPRIREMSDSWVDWGDMATYAQQSIEGMGGKIEQISFKTIAAQQFAQQFTDSFGAGMANLIVQGGKFIDVMKNIGKLMLSAGLQLFIKYMLLGSAGFGVKNGSTGLIGGLFTGSASVGSIGTMTPASASLTLDGQFQIKGTDLVYVMNRAERSLR